MIELILGLLIGKWLSDREKPQKEEYDGSNIKYKGQEFGYIKDGEEPRDLL